MAAYAVLHRPVQPDPEGLIPVAAPVAPAREPLHGVLDALVWHNGTEQTAAGLRLDDPQALPLRPRDWMRFEVTLNRPAYLYVVWLDTEGGVTPLYPWGKDWNDRPVQEPPRQRLRACRTRRPGIAPVGGGPAGIESLLLLAREEPAANDGPAAPLRRSAAGKQACRDCERRRGSATASWCAMSRGARSDQLDQAVARDDTWLRTQGLLRTRLAAWFPLTRAVCFTNEGDR